MNTFETSLLTELREFVGERAAAQLSGSRRRRPSARWGWAVVPAGAAAAGAAMLLSSAPASAYTVHTTSDGDVVVTITKLSDAAGLERALRADGIDARVDYSARMPAPPAGGPGTFVEGTDQGGKHLESPTQGGDGSAPVTGCSLPGKVDVSMSKDAVTFDIAAADVHSSATLYITTSGSNDSGVSGVQLRWQC